MAQRPNWRGFQGPQYGPRVNPLLKYAPAIANAIVKAYRYGPALALSGYAGYKGYSSHRRTRANRPKGGYAKALSKARSKRVSKVNKKRISYLKKRMDDNEATLQYRWRIQEGIKTAGTNKCIYQSHDAMNKSIAETSMAVLKFFDPSNPATLISTNYATGTFQKQLSIQGNSFVTIRNNYHVPVNVEVWLCEVKADTDQTPAGALTASFADIGGISVTSPLTKVQDAIMLKDLWKLKLKLRVCLEAGQEAKCGHRAKTYQYDNSLADTHALSYIKQFKAVSYLFRVEGVTCHDTVQDEQATSQAGIDMKMDRNIIIRYDAGTDLHEVQLNDDSNEPLTTGPAISVLKNETTVYAIT